MGPNQLEISMLDPGETRQRTGVDRRHVVAFGKGVQRNLPIAFQHSRIAERGRGLAVRETAKKLAEITEIFSQALLGLSREVHEDKTLPDVASDFL